MPSLPDRWRSIQLDNRPPGDDVANSPHRLEGSVYCSTPSVRSFAAFSTAPMHSLVADDELPERRLIRVMLR